jgi:tetraacyldisaccharide 4'-kinase
MREPAFWWRQAGVAAGLLAPLGALYGLVAARRLAGRGWRAGVPVVCIGNPTIGGAGKTPLALAVVRILREAGERPVLLSRGYGGTLAGPVQVDPAVHRSADVGDEPLLLARAAPTIVARDRVAGAKAAMTAGASIIVMDDGFQNPSLVKDFSVLVIDARRGIGNGKVTPAGPLRAPLAAQMARADALVVVGEPQGQGRLPDIPAAGIPVFRASLVPDERMIAGLRGSRVLAFAGIGDPEKFFATLRARGIAVTATRAFADHHRYTRAEAKALCEQADRDGLILVTTEKDAARLHGDMSVAELAARTHALPVTARLEDEPAFRSVLLEKVAQTRTEAGRRPQS